MAMTYTAQSTARNALFTQAFPSRRLYQVLPAFSAAPSVQLLRSQSVPASASQFFKRPEVIEWPENLATNKATFIGVVIREMRIKYLDSGNIVANSSIQVSRPIKDDSWFYLEFWGDLAEVAAAHLKVNDTICVSGSVWSEKTTGKDGLEKTFAKVVVEDLKFVKKVNTDKSTVQVQEMSWKEMWENLFDNPTDWFDCREEKINDRQPDFKHKLSSKALWLDNKNTPVWVKERLEKDDVNFQRSRTAEEKWEDLFADPSRWWDNRDDKAGPNFPDFRQKDTKEVLWIDSKSTPYWVKSKLAALDSKSRE